jgi:hypothetical protein
MAFDCATMGQLLLVRRAIFAARRFAFRYCFALQFFAKGRVYPDTTPCRLPIVTGEMAASPKLLVPGWMLNGRIHLDLAVQRRQS